MRRSFAFLLAPAFALGAVLSPLRLVAQQGDFAALRVRVIDASTKAPIAGAQVGFPDLKLFVLTNSKGFAEIKKVPAGDRSLEVTMLGYGTASTTMSLVANAVATGDVALKGEPILIDGITVTRPKVKRSASEISPEELADPKIAHLNVYDAIKISRPKWVARVPLNTLTRTMNPGPNESAITRAGPHPSGGGSQQGITADEYAPENFAAVIIDNVHKKIEDLELINTADITSAVFLSSIDATTLYGIGYSNGAIVITTTHRVDRPDPN